MVRRKTILIIDDDSELREALSEQLELHQEFTPTVAATAAEGIDEAKSGRPDLILLDVDLPDMNGREAMRLMR
ncbi:MAG TPA: response regulator, partial [Caulobacteraceae bacterium]